MKIKGILYLCMLADFLFIRHWVKLKMFLEYKLDCFLDEKRVEDDESNLNIKCNKCGNDSFNIVRQSFGHFSDFDLFATCLKCEFKMIIEEKEGK